MRIQGPNQSSLAAMADQIAEAQRQPLEIAKKRTEKLRTEKNEFTTFAAMVGDLGSSLDGLRSSHTFSKLAVSSSHPDILSAELNGLADLGSYELEVKDIARSAKQLAAGFESPEAKVGFGFMSIERDGLSDLDITIDPGSTLQDVANKINATNADLKASVVNTGISSEPYRLMVNNVKTGALSRINIDPDTTFMDFTEISKGADLNLGFEDIDVKRATNSFQDLVNGVTFNAKQAAPGTKIRIDVNHDIDSTLNGIKAFTDNYNKIADYASTQNKIDPTSKQASGPLAGDSSLRSAMRQLQSKIGGAITNDGSYRSLAEVGITTDPFSGQLKLDENKLKTALSTNYEDVAKLFAKTEAGDGIAERLSQTVKALQDPQHGVIKTKTKALDKIIQDQDKTIERQAERLEQKETNMRRSFNALEAKMAAASMQQDALAARFGGSASSPASQLPGKP